MSYGTLAMISPIVPEETPSKEITREETQESTPPYLLAIRRQALENSWDKEKYTEELQTSLRRHQKTKEAYSLRMERMCEDYSPKLQQLLLAEALLATDDDDLPPTCRSFRRDSIENRVEEIHEEILKFHADEALLKRDQVIIDATINAFQAEIARLRELEDEEKLL